VCAKVRLRKPSDAFVAPLLALLDSITIPRERWIPHLHTHFATANFSASREGKRYALETHDMVKAIRFAGKIYQSALRSRVEALGSEIRSSELLELSMSRAPAKVVTDMRCVDPLLCL